MSATAEMVKTENALEAMKEKLVDLSRQKELTQKQIDQKVANANIYLAEERSRIEADKRIISEERQKLDLARKELQNAVEKMQADKKEAQKEKVEADRVMGQAKFMRTNAEQFVIAVRRAFGVFE